MVLYYGLATARVHLVNMMNADLAPDGCRSSHQASKLLPSPTIIVILLLLLCAKDDTHFIVPVLWPLGRWLAHCTAPVRSKPDSRAVKARLEGARYRNNRQAAHSYLTRLPRASRIQYTSHTPTNSHPLPEQAHWTAT